MNIKKILTKSKLNSSKRYPLLIIQSFLNPMNLKNKIMKGSEISRIEKNSRKGIEERGKIQLPYPEINRSTDGSTSRSQSSRIQVALETAVLEAWPVGLEDRRGVQQEPETEEEGRGRDSGSQRSSLRGRVWRAPLGTEADQPCYYAIAFLI